MHYGRWRRNGHPELLCAPQLEYAHSLGYVKVRMPEHPLANWQGIVFQHRQVLFDAIGPGVHPCNWCGLEVEWGSTLEADHCDSDRSNNVLVNLVPCCHSCNSGRGQAKNIEAWARHVATKCLLRAHAVEHEHHVQRIVNDHARRTATEQPGGFNV